LEERVKNFMTSLFKAHELVTGDYKPKHVAVMQPIQKRIRVALAGKIIADSTSVLIMHETNHLPVYYFPFADVRMDLMKKTDHSTY